MAEIRVAEESSAEVLALLGRTTYVESHGHFIDDKDDLSKYTIEAFSISKTKQDLNNPDVLFYILYAEDFPVGYAKLVLNAKHSSVDSQSTCRLERIYILKDFIQFGIGQELLDFVMEKAKQLELETMWLSVYFENIRAIRFYDRNMFEKVGELSFPVNGKDYKTLVFSKKLQV